MSLKQRSQVLVAVTICSSPSSPTRQGFKGYNMLDFVSDSGCALIIKEECAAFLVLIA